MEINGREKANWEGTSFDEWVKMIKERDIRIPIVGYLPDDETSVHTSLRIATKFLHQVDEMRLVSDGRLKTNADVMRADLFTGHRINYEIFKSPKEVGNYYGKSCHEYIKNMTKYWEQREIIKDMEEVFRKIMYDFKSGGMDEEEMEEKLRDGITVAEEDIKNELRISIQFLMRKILKRTPKEDEFG